MILNGRALINSSIFRPLQLPSDVSTIESEQIHIRSITYPELLC
jgi:hypothetical protein